MTERDPVIVERYEQAIRERLHIETWIAHEDGPLIDLKDIATLGGLAPGTPGMARQRTAKGTATVPFPDPDEDEGMRWEDKPLFRAYTVMDYFRATGNWPLGQAARPAQRKKREAPKTPPAAPAEKMNWTELCDADPRLAASIHTAGLNDGNRRSVKQWQHRYDHTSGHRHEVVHRPPAAR